MYFCQKENVFLKEHCCVLKTLARGLDVLQRNKLYMFYGTLLSTLENTIKKRKALVPHLSPMLVGLVYATESPIICSFAKIFESNNAINKAVTLPKSE